MYETLDTLLLKFEGLVQASVAGNYPEDWDENFITRDLLRAIRANANDIVILGEASTRVEWRAWKQVGSAETQFGDIAILVDIRQANGTSLRGVGFLEAKRWYPHRAFATISWPQLETILSNAPSSRLLLYDFVRTSAFASGVSPIYAPAIWPVLGIHPPVQVRATYATAVSVSTALALRLTDRKLHGYALPFSHQVLLRYLNGFDLEFSAKALAVVTGADSSLGRSRYVLTVAVGHDVVPNTDLPIHDSYQPFEQGEEGTA
jgi:hypothetical protein